jgi:molybdopterin-biosynthesis enzyme MoeA-like protein
MGHGLFRHDDITYSSVAKAFGLGLEFHQESFARMKKLSIPHPSQPNFSWDILSPSLTAKLRMVHLPLDTTRDEEGQVLFVDDKLWVPIVVVNGNIYILPGVPRLFEQLLDGLKPVLLPRLADLDGKGTHMILFSTPLGESAVAPYLTELAERVEPRGIKVGSYPRWGKKKNTVTLVGKDSDYMESLVAEIEQGVQGRRVKVEGEDDSDNGET